MAIGTALAVQARINGTLGRELGDGTLAALISFGGSLVLLVVMAALLPTMRAGGARLVAALRRGRLRPWHFVGGLGGASLILSQSLTVASIGVAVFTVAVVAGQAASSLIVDRLGVGPGGPRSITIGRVGGAVLALGAVALALSDRLGVSGVVVLTVLPALAGAAIAWQQALNGRLGVTGGPLSAALVNFVVGTAALGAGALVDVAVRGLPDSLPANPLLYLGGPLGVVFVSAAAVIVRVTGVLLFGLCTVAGQLVGSVLLDLFAPTAGQPLSVATIAGTALAFVAVAITALPGRRTPANQGRSTDR